MIEAFSHFQSFFNSFSPTDLDINHHRLNMILSFDAKHFDKGKKEGASKAALVASVSGTQAEHFLHENVVDFPVSAAEGLYFSSAINHHPPRHSLGTPDTFKDDEIIYNLSARPSSLSTAFATDKLNESRVAGTDAKPRRNSNSGAEAKAECTTIIGETGSMVRTIDSYTDEKFHSLIYSCEIQPLTRN